jgi:two-component system chemotaxis response regulator CheB
MPPCCDPPVLFSRPSIDVLLESCAEAYGSRLLGMVLTGANEDGARGLASIKARGGLTAVQDPADAAHVVMPEAAIRLADPEFVMPLTGLRGLLHTVVRR